MQRGETKRTPCALDDSSSLTREPYVANPCSPPARRSHRAPGRRDLDPLLSGAVTSLDPPRQERTPDFPAQYLPHVGSAARDDGGNATRRRLHELRRAVRRGQCRTRKGCTGNATLGGRRVRTAKNRSAVQESSGV